MAVEPDHVTDPGRSPNTERLVIRKARRQDAKAVARIYNHYVGTSNSTFDNRGWSVAQTLSQMSGEGSSGWYVAEDDVDVLGWASVRRYSARFGYRYTCESAIYLDPCALGFGIGDQLQQRVDEHCRQHNIHHAVARVANCNQRSIAFHLRHGYELVGVQREVGRLDDQWVDVTLLQKIFRP